MTDARIDALAEAYVRTRVASAKADEAKKVARDALAKAVRVKGKVRTSNWSVVCATSTRTTLDLPKVRIAFDVTPFEIHSDAETVRVTRIESM